MPLIVDDVTLYTTKDLSGMLGIARSTLCQYLREGKMSGRKMAGAWYVTADDLRDFLISPQAAYYRPRPSSPRSYPDVPEEIAAVFAEVEEIVEDEPSPSARPAAETPVPVAKSEPTPKLDLPPVPKISDTQPVHIPKMPAALLDPVLQEVPESEAEPEAEEVSSLRWDALDEDDHEALVREAQRLKQEAERLEELYVD